MLDLKEQPQLPNYELKLGDGTMKSYDSILVSYGLKDLDGVEDPAKVQEIVNRVFEIEVDALTSMIILRDFIKFEEEHLEEPLKKVFGRELFSVTSTVSRPPSSKPSAPENSSG